MAWCKYLQNLLILLLQRVSLLRTGTAADQILVAIDLRDALGPGVLVVHGSTDRIVGLWGPEVGQLGVVPQAILRVGLAAK